MHKEISYRELEINPMTMISDEGMLLTAGSRDDGYNTMTVCWGTLGALWGHGKGLPVATVFVRPQRYTREFMDSNEYFTLSVLPRENRKALGYLGTHSGRDGDKVAAAGLHPAFTDGATYFEEAKLVLVCRKLYRGRLHEDGFFDKDVMESNYPERDFHYVYTGEIVKVLVKDGE